jgi:hypothetical protein
MIMSITHLASTVLLGSIIALPMALPTATAAEQACELVTVTFEEGTEGWVGPIGSGGSTGLEGEGGNPGANLHTVFNNFGISFENSTNPAFVQDLAVYDQVTIGIDLKVEDIRFFGAPVTRPWLLEIRDFDNVPSGYSWVSVWYLFDWVGESEWTSWEVTIIDPSMRELPPGWGGYGAEDPDTFEPILPANRTFTDVLAGADEIVFTTYQPGYYFGFTDFDVRLDNIRIAACHLPSCPSDLNDDGLVDGADLTMLLGEWGLCQEECPGDINGDGIVDGTDLTIVLGDWGPCAG